MVVADDVHPRRKALRADLADDRTTCGIDLRHVDRVSVQSGLQHRLKNFGSRRDAGFALCIKPIAPERCEIGRRTVGSIALLQFTKQHQAIDRAVDDVGCTGGVGSGCVDTRAAVDDENRLRAAWFSLQPFLD
jgi:hypothetical protein